jgi:Rad3-related DNA helicase
MTKNTEQKYMQDSMGRLVPVESVKPIDIERDALVKQIVESARSLNAALADFKGRTHADIAAFAELSAERYGVKLGGRKGNLCLSTFDGRFRVLRAISDVLVFDERLQAAKHLIDECLNEWTDGARKEIRTLINDAFAVDKEGQISTARVLTLRRLNFDDARWNRAMAAISDSLGVATSRSYLRIYERGADGNYKQLNLDLASA